MSSLPLPLPRVPRQVEGRIDDVWEIIIRNAINFLNAYVETEYLQGEITEELYHRLVQCLLDIDGALFDHEDRTPYKHGGGNTS